MAVGKMNRRITLYSVTEVENPISGQIELRKKLERVVWAERNPKRGDEKQKVRAIEEIETVEYKIRKISTLNLTWLIEDNGVFYDIKFIDDDKFYLYLTCRKTDWKEVFDFEGTMTVGSLSGEGGIVVYGFMNIGGDKFGNIDGFYTYGEYEGIYWSEGTLLVWGVDVSILSIDGTEYTDGTYNENGYTEFEIAENPFTGTTAEIKIQGTIVEIWDYTGVLTVGSPDNDRFGFDSGNYDIFGSITPEYLWAYNGFKYIVYIQGVISCTGEIGKIKIDNEVFIATDILDGLTSFTEEKGNPIINPFPAVGETCTIKIKI
jgi:SPP1 family predicted phage head-tail adaptor